MLIIVAHQDIVNYIEQNCPWQLSIVYYYAEQTCPLQISAYQDMVNYIEQSYPWQPSMVYYTEQGAPLLCSTSWATAWSTVQRDIIDKAPQILG